MTTDHTGEVIRPKPYLSFEQTIPISGLDRSPHPRARCLAGRTPNRKRFGLPGRKRLGRRVVRRPPGRHSRSCGIRRGLLTPAGCRSGRNPDGGSSYRRVRTGLKPVQPTGDHWFPGSSRSYLAEQVPRRAVAPLGRNVTDSNEPAAPRWYFRPRPRCRSGRFPEPFLPRSAPPWVEPSRTNNVRAPRQHRQPRLVIGFRVLSNCFAP